ncbi:MAG: alpha/beta fold hydrolase [Ralstonia sp.]|jgi:triacylglycerol esterase/lipase EstA (alpha/beta hydrolase family)|uniref:Alpha/beta fold hydrolase n=3 Tax=Pseudomonadota TaxID=1224 RepID=A0A2P4RLT5_RALPI|nr:MULTISPECIES: alpha/beta fold hydrolase [Ralstonia]MBA4202428.1 permease [Ralstonia sp.]MBA4232856.1 permease [Ralstonia sp.]MBA4237238.1 permease [Ralstonia sp.]MBA4280778.1 permease [Ralstonia sp.]MBA4294500.1 permease [Ralstonia sp.]
MTHADLPASPVPFASLTAATVRRIAVALQCAATIAVGWAAHDWAGWHWPAATLLAGAALVLGYLLSVGWAFLVSLTSLGTAIPDDPMWDRMPVPCEQRIGVTGFIACWLRECVSVAWMFNVLQPFRARAAFDTPAGDGKRVPVLMIHGYGCNHAVWLPMQQHLAAAGHPTDAIDLMPLLGDIDDYARDMTAAVARLTRMHGRAPVLLCHSMGGLAARALLRQSQPCPVAHVITLGTPHRGTAMARTGRGHNVRQMAWASPWLRQLAASETPASRARITSIFSWHDSIVGPAGASWLEGARHIPFAGIGHVSLLCDARVRDAVLAELARIEGVSAIPSA